MDDFAQAAFREQDANRIVQRRSFLAHMAIWAAVNVLLIAVWAIGGGGFPWFVFVALGWGIGVVAHGVSALLVRDVDAVVVERERSRSQR